MSYNVVIPEFSLNANGDKVGKTIPDFGISGGAPSLFPVDLNVPLSSIKDVNLRLEIAGGQNADLSAYLLFGDDPADPFAVLFGQILGTTSGMNAWLDDQAPSDIETAGGAGVLTGTFRPAGPQNLSSFNGFDPNAKTWYLAIADNSAGLESTLLEWELQLSGIPTTAVPETAGLCGLIGLSACLALQRALGRSVPSKATLPGFGSRS